MISMIKHFIINPDNIKEVIGLIEGFYQSDVFFDGEAEAVRNKLKELGESKVLEEFEKGTFRL